MTGAAPHGTNARDSRARARMPSLRYEGVLPSRSPRSALVVLVHGCRMNAIRSQTDATCGAPVGGPALADVELQRAAIPDGELAHAGGDVRDAGR